ncbi:hypothetical protein O181_004997 [Austropuccinia psidii MF-1]|uniref:Uncharacterized protein n=1 Tax=Austropuccinia psidii MF-1 TaxID=1389203 RepID=A0A9Q3GGB2_9BASI|nr:hypothetical protein [Austropuccinia psidii MF-1]
MGHPKAQKLHTWWHKLIERNEMLCLTPEWRKKNPQPPTLMQTAVKMTSPEGNGSNQKMKKTTEPKDGGKEKVPISKTYCQGYGILKIKQEAMENLPHMATAFMEIQKKEEAI